MSGSDLDYQKLIDYCASTGYQVLVVALDLPIADYLITDRKCCDNEISKLNEGRGAGTHSPSSERPGAISFQTYHQLTELGYNWSNTSVEEKSFIEVYPHTAIIELFGYEYRFPYKVQKKSKYWPKATQEERNRNSIRNLNELREKISSKVEKVLEMVPILDENQKYSMTFLKGYEDLLDAILCALTGYFYSIAVTMLRSVI